MKKDSAQLRLAGTPAAVEPSLSLPARTSPSEALAQNGPPPANAPLVLSVADAAAILGVSDDLVYGLLQRGHLPCLRMGRRKVIPRRAVELLVERALADFDPSHLAETLPAMRNACEL